MTPATQTFRSLVRKDPALSRGAQAFSSSVTERLAGTQAHRQGRRHARVKLKASRRTGGTQDCCPSTARIAPQSPSSTPPGRRCLSTHRTLPPRAHGHPLAAASQKGTESRTTPAGINTTYRQSPLEPHTATVCAQEPHLVEHHRHCDGAESQKQDPHHVGHLRQVLTG